MNSGVVTLVGAGPGAVDLLTLRAIRKLEEADIIFYDRLVSPEVLAFARPDCELIYVGKEPTMDSQARQERAHTLMIGHARMGKTVVRLKGGDPFVFGRGSEELLRLRAAGIEVEIVPGISSAIAAPQSAWIPVTHRGLASSFGVFAGRPGDNVDQGGVDWLAAARMRTAVFMMGVARLPLIVAELIEHGRSPETPIAIVCSATWEDEKVYTGTLANICEVAREATSPATIVVGEVVGVREAALAAAHQAAVEWEAVG